MQAALASHTESPPRSCETATFDGQTLTLSNDWLVRLMRILTGRDDIVWENTNPDLDEDELSFCVEFEGPHFLYLSEQ